jgi:MFS family permease
VRGAFAAVAFAMVIVFAGGNLVSPLWPIYRAELHFGAFALTIVFAVYAFGALFALFGLGGLSDVIGRRPILLASVIATVAASLLFAYAHDIWWLIAARFVQGLAVGGMSASANAALNDFAYSANPRHASVVGSIATSVGFASGPFLAGILADVAPHPTQTSFFVLVAFALVAIAALVPLPNSGRRPGTVYRGNMATVPAGIRRPFARATFTFAVGWVGGSIFLSLGPSIIAQFLGTSSHAIAGTTLLVFFGSSGLGQVLARRTGTLLTLRIADIAIGAGLLLAAAAGVLHSLPLFFLAVVLAGAAQGIALLGGLELVNAIAPEAHRAGVLSAFFLCGYLLVAFLVPVIGWVADSAGLYRALLYFALLIAVAAAAALIDLMAWKAPAANALQEAGGLVSKGP